MFHNLNCKLTTKFDFEEIYTNPDKNNMEHNYVYCFILSAIGDTLGYMNGAMEFNLGATKFSSGLTWSLFSFFLENGGFSGIDLEGRIVSDDTVFHIATARGLLKSGNIYENIVKEYVNELNEPSMEKRGIGNTLKNSLEKIRDGLDWKLTPYNERGGGNGAAMRMMCIGLMYHKKSDLQKLVETSIIIGKMTHNNPIGYLGGIVSAYVTSLAIQKVNITHWLDYVIGLLSGNIIDEYIKKTVNTNEYNKYVYEKMRYVDMWKIYREILYNKKFADTRQKVRKMEFQLPHRMEFYNKHFSLIKDNVNVVPGANGLDSVIIAFDCLMDAQDNWELLVYFGMINAGDSDTIGTICAAWFGAYYGRPGNLLKNHWLKLEYLPELTKIGKQMYNEFYKKK